MLQMSSEVYFDVTDVISGTFGYYRYHQLKEAHYSRHISDTFMCYIMLQSCKNHTNSPQKGS